MLKTYFLLTKPGIIMGNLITTAGAFVLGSRGHFDPLLFLATASGLFFVIASACVFNNAIDREADRKMARTKSRALAKGSIPLISALAFAVIMGVIGLVIFAQFTNVLAVVSASVGFFVYVGLYSLWKYRSRYATLVGSISGAIPPVVGYCAASNTFDAGAAILFMILVLWQMPHFYSIALFRIDEYAAASIPVLPLEKGIFRTKIHMVLYILAFIAALFMLRGYIGTVALTISAFLGLAWLALCFKGFRVTDDKVWARQMFRLSLVVVTAFSIVIAI